GVRESATRSEKPKKGHAVSQHNFRRIASSCVLLGALASTAGAQRDARRASKLLVELDTYVYGRMLWQGPTSSAIRSLPIYGNRVAIPLDGRGDYNLVVDAVGFVPSLATFVHDDTLGRRRIGMALAAGADVTLTMSLPSGELVDDVHVTFAPEELTGLSKEELSDYLRVLQTTLDPSVNLSTQWSCTIQAGSAGSCV